MLMDIACPVEFQRFEDARFGDGRRQAYLTFLNESEQTVTALSGRMALRGRDGRLLEKHAVSFSRLQAAPGAPFTCHLAVDGFQDFAGASVAVESVSFAQGEPWTLDTSRLTDCTPPLLPPGPHRTALVAVAGPDAACYPEARGALWVCVCGRFNRWRWLNCRRCKRDRNATLTAFTPERTQIAYEDKLAAIRAEDARRLRQQGGRSETKKREAAASVRQRQAIRAVRSVVTLAAVTATVGLLVFGAMKVTARMQAAAPPASAAAHDILTPL